MRKRSEGPGDAMERTMRAIKSCTPGARRVLERIALGDDKYVHSASAHGLIKKNLIVPRKRVAKHLTHETVEIIGYEVPAHIQAALRELTRRDQEEKES